MNNELHYPGEELALFQQAHNWKKYFSKKLVPYIHGTVAEVGAGLGANTKLLYNERVTKWVMYEPDPNMYAKLNEKIANNEVPANTLVVQDTLTGSTCSFDTIIYIDVLEHIEKDKEELSLAAELLNKNGYLIVLSPAFPQLYSPFDKAIGHHRRYTKKMIKNISPITLSLIHNQYYDSIGFFAGYVNRLFLHQRYPSQKQVKFWDDWMVPLSKFTDPTFFHQFGKSIISIWQK